MGTNTRRRQTTSEPPPSRPPKAGIMKRVITFYTHKDDERWGSIWIGDDGRLEYDTPSLSGVAEAWTDREEAFMERYRGRSNGYVYTKTTEED